MLIEVRNYNTKVAKGALLASFDLINRDFGIIIRDCKHFHTQQGKEFILLPNKSTKNPDGTWGKPSPYIEYINKDMWYEIQNICLHEIKKLLVPQESLLYPHGMANSNPQLQNPQQPEQTNFFDNCPF